MKKTIVSMIMGAALILGGGVYAQTQTDGTTGATKQNAQKECCQGEKGGKGEKKGGKKDAKKGGKKGNRQGQKPAFNPFEGVQLTADQQQRLQTLQQGLGPVVLDKQEQAKIKENPNLTPEQKQQLKAERKAKKLEAKKKYMNGVKEILSPDQYVIFLENVYLYGPDKQFKGGKHGKMPKRGGGDKAKVQKDQTSANN